MVPSITGQHVKASGWTDSEMFYVHYFRANTQIELLHQTNMQITLRAITILAACSPR